MNDQRKFLRNFLKDDIRQKTDFRNTDQNRGIRPPAIEKEAGPEAKRIDLPKPAEWESVADTSVKEAIGKRKSHRQYNGEALSLVELSFLLWSVQGVREVISGTSFRTVPSAGCRHAFETYLAIFNVDGLAEGLYRYLPSSHQLVLESTPERLADKTTEACLNQSFAGKAAVTFIWTAIPYRMEWRYAEASYKVIALDAGHVCQNLYLACESINSGTCAIAAYDQQKADQLVGADGEDEFVVYISPVGKVR